MVLTGRSSRLAGEMISVLDDRAWVTVNLIAWMCAPCSRDSRAVLTLSYTTLVKRVQYTELMTVGKCKNYLTGSLMTIYINVTMGIYMHRFNLRWGKYYCSIVRFYTVRVKFISRIQIKTILTKFEIIIAS